jgi:hypothetical protein
MLALLLTCVSWLQLDLSVSEIKLHYTLLTNKAFSAKIDLFYAISLLEGKSHEYVLNMTRVILQKMDKPESEHQPSISEIV